MNEYLNTDEVRIWKMFLRAHASLMRTMESDIQSAHGISHVWYDVLTQLSLEKNKRMTHSRLAERLLVKVTGVTRLVDRMVRQGLVVRRSSRKDRRTSYVVMTENGEQALAESTPRVLETVQHNFVRHLKTEEMPAIRNLLARILDE